MSCVVFIYTMHQRILQVVAALLTSLRSSLQPILDHFHGNVFSSISIKEADERGNRCLRDHVMLSSFF